MNSRLILFIIFSVLAFPAQAEWKVATSRHFVIYSEQSASSLKTLATQLEQFDQSVRIVRGMRDDPVAPSARVSVYVVRHLDAVRRLTGNRNSSVAGFYISQLSGPLAVVPDRVSNVHKDFTPQSVFLHEYTHHLMYEQLDRPMPRWLSEGLAEMFATARFNPDGSIFLGISPAHRSSGIFEPGKLSLEQLLAGNSGRMTGIQVESLYGRGWLLTHYLTFDSGRRGQLDDYVSRLAKGEEPLAATQSAFGDLRTLERDINRYVRQSRLPSLRIDLDPALVGSIEIRSLGAAASAVMPLRIRQKVGIDEKQAPRVLAEARAIAARYPNDPLVMTALAEAAFDAGDFPAALAAATKASELDPKSAEARIYQGRAWLAQAKSSDRSVAIRSARTAFLAANALEPEHPEPLALFYESFIEAGERPTANAIEALHYASALIPSEHRIRWMSAQQHLIDRKPADARRALVPIAYNPHGGERSKVAAEAIAMIDRGEIDTALTRLNEPTEEDEAS